MSYNLEGNKKLANNRKHFTPNKKDLIIQLKQTATRNLNVRSQNTNKSLFSRILKSSGLSVAPCGTPFNSVR